MVRLYALCSIVFPLVTALSDLRLTHTCLGVTLVIVIPKRRQASKDCFSAGGLGSGTFVTSLVARLKRVRFCLIGQNECEGITGMTPGRWPCVAYAAGVRVRGACSEQNCKPVGGGPHARAATAEQRLLTWTPGSSDRCAAKHLHPFSLRTPLTRPFKALSAGP
jgi:hypothetical protein